MVLVIILNLYVSEFDLNNLVDLKLFFVKDENLKQLHFKKCNINFITKLIP